MCTMQHLGIQSLLNRSFNSAICVVGAGRGGILARCFNVKQRTPDKVRLYAVEKNPNAFVTYVCIKITQLYF